MVCLVGSKACRAARTATVFPAPTSPVISDPVFGDAPADPSDGLAVGRVAVQHAGGEVAAERGAGEPEEALPPVDHDASLAVSFTGGDVEVGEEVELAGQFAGRLRERGVVDALRQFGVMGVAEKAGVVDP